MYHHSNNRPIGWAVPKYPFNGCAERYIPNKKRKLNNDTIDIALLHSDRKLYFHLLPVDIYKHILYISNL